MKVLAIVITEMGVNRVVLSTNFFPYKIFIIINVISVQKLMWILLHSIDIINAIMIKLEINVIIICHNCLESPIFFLKQKCILQ